jgi:hypothetical protein
MNVRIKTNVPNVDFLAFSLLLSIPGSSADRGFDETQTCGPARDRHCNCARFALIGLGPFTR